MSLLHKAMTNERAHMPMVMTKTLSLHRRKLVETVKMSPKEQLEAAHAKALADAKEAKEGDSD